LRRLALVCLTFLSSCYINTQRHPKPMGGPEDLPPGAANLFAVGPEEALVVRHSDPVQVRRPGEVSSFPMHFYDKTLRVNAGSWVQSGAGGKVEVLFPGDTTLTLTGRGTAVLGSTSRGEPVALFLELDQARISLGPGEYVRLLGGAVLSGESGPYVVHHLRGDILLVANRSSKGMQLAFREERMTLAPGEVVHLPLLEAGCGPIEVDPAFERLSGPRFDVNISGALQLTRVAPTAVELLAEGPHEVRAFGLVLRLDEGDRVRFDAFQGPSEDGLDSPETNGTAAMDAASGSNP
jgi:hypothetical protein